MAALLVLYILIGVALVALGVFIVFGQKAAANRKKLDDSGTPPDQRNTSGSARV